MEDTWEDSNPVARFRRKLLRKRADILLNSPTWLQSLRHDWKALQETERVFQKVFEERGIDFAEHVIMNTSSRKPLPTGRSKKELAKINKRKIIYSDEMPIRTNRRWQIWLPVQNFLSKSELFMPLHLFELMCEFVPHVDEVEPKPEYDAEQADEFTLPCIKII